MRFKTFLEAQVKPYDREDMGVYGLASHIRKHCSEAQSNPLQIWRGSKQKLKSGRYDPSTGERKSQNTANYYTRFFETNPVNKEFPLRSKSFIATTERDRAGEYGKMWGAHNPNADPNLEGQLMLVYPYNGTKIGVVNERDIWDIDLHFKGKINNSIGLASLNDVWQELFNVLGKDESFVPSLPEAIALLKKADPLVVYKKLKHGDVFDRWVASDKSPEELVEDFIDQLPAVYSYEKLGCTVETTKTLKAKKSEIWFSGPCIMIADKDIESVKKFL